MCGRFAASASREEVIATFAIDEVVDEVQPSFNLAPTDEISAVVERLDDAGELRRKLVGLRWGLVPSWAKDASGAARLINARWETVDSKPSFRKAFAARRCIVPADGYYEWVVDEAAPRVKGRPFKQPYFLRPADGGVFAMAGLYEFWRPGDGPWLVTCAIITRQAVDSIGHIHDRMPVSVPREHWDAWLDPGFTDAEGVRALVADAPEPLDAVKVAPLVNNVRNDGPELIVPLTDRPEPPRMGD